MGCVGRAEAEVEVPAMGCGIRGDSTLCEGGLKAALNILLRLLGMHVQSSLHGDREQVD